MYEVNCEYNCQKLNRLHDCFCRKLPYLRFRGQGGIRVRLNLPPHFCFTLGSPQSAVRIYGPPSQSRTHNVLLQQGSQAYLKHTTPTHGAHTRSVIAPPLLLKLATRCSPAEAAIQHASLPPHLWAQFVDAVGGTWRS
ncbi:hypothetical protein JMJ77_0005434 [Colletotrichum scovillei]|uniref:Uncharacterized protein n=1 Tax=Colletotrichum scovillei TaxID=1209932 RepID=A0A9P7RGY5_9PEZI|nr:hypothetical protein JMJ77_0005434 [Colletotrichum scovillei]KAG7076692.1 hypothetical protein JMJ76_0013952 [Colletotrichum scovillei]KAG7083786.1 hypothetical protein JMJ78_0009228 [Colletotrichum scovillei]